MYLIISLIHPGAKSGMTHKSQSLFPLPEVRILTGDSRELLRDLPTESIQCCVTSPPYWGLRDYDHSAQIGAESSPEQYVTNLVKIFWILWLNVGDDYDKKWAPL